MAAKRRKKLEEVSSEVEETFIVGGRVAGKVKTPPEKGTTARGRGRGGGGGGRAGAKAILLSGLACTRFARPLRASADTVLSQTIDPQRTRAGMPKAPQTSADPLHLDPTPIGNYRAPRLAPEWGGVQLEGILLLRCSPTAVPVRIHFWHFGCRPARSVVNHPQPQIKTVKCV